MKKKNYKDVSYQIRVSPLQVFIECYHDLIAGDLLELVLKKPIVNAYNEEIISAITTTTTSTTTSTTSITTVSGESSEQLDPAEMMVLLEKCEQFQKTCYKKLKDVGGFTSTLYTFQVIEF